LILISIGLYAAFWVGKQNNAEEDDEGGKASRAILATVLAFALEMGMILSICC
jgi:hypothetical protein